MSDEFDISWRYQARCYRVVDGDTLDVVVDVGFKARRAERIRLLGVDTAEVYGVAHDSEEYERGREHSAFVKGWIAEADDGHDGLWPLVVETEQETGSFNRYLADVYRKIDGDGTSLSDDLVAEFGAEVARDA